ncbi:DMT family transporter [Gordoniibacillus kamchatkensis]|uniref:DMT family transporter n=1 Tax=Gordoniibacillus kamchatkensis TaxID=1590651 RepID=UPI0006973193|nr:DMT family transporter [Paenibacillus sp. VKM B-2647]
MDRLKLTLVMVVWGSIGVFTRHIELSPFVLAFLRAVIALPVLLVFIGRRPAGQRISFPQTKPYLVSGALIGLAWAALFYGFQNTNISTAVIIYNMCPVYVMLVAPLVLKERLTRLRVGIVGISFIGLCLVVGTGGFGPAGFSSQGMWGMILSGVSGMLYAAIVIINRKAANQVDHALATFLQMGAASMVLLPFVLAEGEWRQVLAADGTGILLTCILGVVHTGLAYNLYFSTYHRVSSIEIASYGYLEPVFGIVFSVLLLGETLAMTQLIGGLMILGSTYLGEWMHSVNPTTSKSKSTP